MFATSLNEDIISKNSQFSFVLLCSGQAVLLIDDIAHTLIKSDLLASIFYQLLASSQHSCVFGIIKRINASLVNLSAARGRKVHFSSKFDVSKSTPLYLRF